jgi:hypothetical protein
LIALAGIGKQILSLLVAAQIAILPYQEIKFPDMAMPTEFPIQVRISVTHSLSAPVNYSIQYVLKINNNALLDCVV